MYYKIIIEQISYYQIEIDFNFFRKDRRKFRPFQFHSHEQGSCANFRIQNPDFILTEKSVFPDFQKPIKWPGDWVWP